MTINKYLTTKEAADMLRLSPLTITKWVREGKIGGIHIGSRRWLIPESEIKRLLLLDVEELSDKLSKV